MKKLSHHTTRHKQIMRLLLVLSALVMALALAGCDGLDDLAGTNETDTEVSGIPQDEPENGLDGSDEEPEVIETVVLPESTVSSTDLVTDTTDMVQEFDETAEPLTDDMAEPAIVVEDQAVIDGTVLVTSVRAAEPGWIVIHADDDGAPGPVIGQAAVEPGETENVVVEIDESAATETLHAMLHIDAGTLGTYEFPGDDVPATAGDEVVVSSFTLN